MWDRDFRTLLNLHGAPAAEPLPRDVDGEGPASSAGGDSHTGNFARFPAPLGEISPVSPGPRQSEQLLWLRNHLDPCVL